MATEKRLIDSNALLKKAYYEDKELVVDVDDIENAPTVDATEVVHGHWYESVNYGYCCCSNCRDVYIRQEWLTDGKWNYCPNCGAKMDGVTKFGYS